MVVVVVVVLLLEALCDEVVGGTIV